MSEEKGRAALEDTSRGIAEALEGAMPPGIGFALLIFNFGEDGHVAWISNAQRDTMRAAIEELFQKWDSEGGHH